jgi:hypothetical protein
MQLPRAASTIAGVSSGKAACAAQSFHFFLESQLLEFHPGESIGIGAGALVFRAYAGIQIGVTGFQALDAGLQAHGASLARSFDAWPSEHDAEWQRKRNAIAPENAILKFGCNHDGASGLGSPC